MPKQPRPTEQWAHLSDEEIDKAIIEAENAIEACVRQFDYQGGMGAINRLQNLRLERLERQVKRLKNEIHR